MMYLLHERDFNFDLCIWLNIKALRPEKFTWVAQHNLVCDSPKIVLEF